MGEIPQKIPKEAIPVIPTADISTFGALKISADNPIILKTPQEEVTAHTGDYLLLNLKQSSEGTLSKEILWKISPAIGTREGFRGSSEELHQLFASHPQVVAMIESQAAELAQKSPEVIETIKDILNVTGGYRSGMEVKFSNSSGSSNFLDIELTYPGSDDPITIVSQFGYGRIETEDLRQKAETRNSPAIIARYTIKVHEGAFHKTLHFGYSRDSARNDLREIVVGEDVSTPRVPTAAELRILLRMLQARRLGDHIQSQSGLSYTNSERKKYFHLDSNLQLDQVDESVKTRAEMMISDIEILLLFCMNEEGDKRKLVEKNREPSPHLFKIRLPSDGQEYIVSNLIGSNRDQTPENVAELIQESIRERQVLLLRAINTAPHITGEIENRGTLRISRRWQRADGQEMVQAITFEPQYEQGEFHFLDVSLSISHPRSGNSGNKAGISLVFQWDEATGGYICNPQQVTSENFQRLTEHGFEPDWLEEMLKEGARKVLIAKELLSLDIPGSLFCGMVTIHKDNFFTQDPDRDMLPRKKRNARYLYPPKNIENILQWISTVLEGKISFYETLDKKEEH